MITLILMMNLMMTMSEMEMSKRSDLQSLRVPCVGNATAVTSAVVRIKYRSNNGDVRVDDFKCYETDCNGTRSDPIRSDTIHLDS